MASKCLLIAVAVIVAMVSPATAAVFGVGGVQGWRLNVDYQAWAAGKEFHVGDTLFFSYPIGKHNVVKVNGTDFKACSEPADAVPLTTGFDIINLATAGRKWYICSVGTHCASGNMKLFITVLPAKSSAPSSAPAPAPTALPAPQKSNRLFRVLGKLIPGLGN